MIPNDQADFALYTVAYTGWQRTKRLLEILAVLVVYGLLLPSLMQYGINMHISAMVAIIVLPAACVIFVARIFLFKLVVTPRGVWHRNSIGMKRKHGFEEVKIQKCNRDQIVLILGEKRKVTIYATEAEIIEIERLIADRQK